MTYRAFAVLLGSLLLAACGSSAKTINTPTLVRVLRDVGFRNLNVISSQEQLKKLARSLHRPELARNPLNADTILTRGYSSPLTMPLTAVRLPSAEAAARRFQNDQPFLRGNLSRDERRLLPSAYRASRLSEEDVCNVVLTSYNPTNDQSLRRRFRTAIARLRQHC